jgi:serine/threonine-protein kinase
MRRVVQRPFGSGCKHAPTRRARRIKVASKMGGEVIAGRYRVVRKIGSGGMGVVYEAEAEAGRRVAVKVLVDAELAKNDAAVKRFQREVSTAARVESPHIAALLDSGVGADGSPYMVLELLQGEDLSHAVARLGALAPAAAVRIVAQAALGVSAAHAAGVVHRDIKPGNLFLAREGGAIVVKVLDFGIAKASRAELDADALTAMTRTGALLGTPLYMSPEQAEGLKSVDARSDVWSLGVVLYEALAGRTPFHRTGSVGQVILAICSKPIEPIDSAAPWVDAELAAVVRRAMERDPARRFESAGELAAALAPLCPGGSPALEPGDIARLDEAVRRAHSAGPATLVAPDPTADTLGAPPSARVIEPPDASTADTVASHADALTAPATRAAATAAAPARRARGRVVAVALAVVALAAGGGALGVRALRPSHAVEASARRRGVAVLGLKDLARRPDTAWISVAVGEMLVTELAAGGSLRPLAPEAIARARADLGLHDGDAASEALIAAAQKTLGADLCVVGSYLTTGDASAPRVRLDVRVLDARSGDVAAQLSEEGPVSTLSDVVGRVGAKLRASLGAKPTSEEGDAGRAAVPTSAGAIRPYAEGLARLRAFDALGATSVLEQAVAAEPDNVLAHSALAEALTQLGRDAAARAEAKRAFELATNLGREDKLLVEGRYRMATHDYDAAIRVYSTLFGFFSDDIEHGLRLASAQIAAGKAIDATATIAALRKLPPPACDDPRIDIADADVGDIVGDPKRVLAACARAREAAAPRGAKAMIAHARYREAWAYYNLGQTEAAVRAAEDALRRYEEIGDKRGVGRAHSSLSAADQLAGHLHGQLEHIVSAVAIARQAGAETDLSEHLYNEAHSLTHLARYPEARATLAEAVTVSRASDNRDILLSADITRAEIEFAEGKLEAARASSRAASAALEREGDARMAAWSDCVGAEFALAAGDVGAARALNDGSLAVREKFGLAQFSAEGRVLRARIALEDGKPADAEADLRRALELFRSTGSIEGRATADAVLALTLLAEGKLPEGASSEAPTTRVLVAIAKARVGAASGAADEAARALQKAVAEASAVGDVPRRLDAELALCEVDRARHDKGADARCAALAEEARGAGFALVARRASR